MREIMRQNANCISSRMPIVQVTWKIPNQRQAESCAFLEARHLSQLLDLQESRQLCHTAAPKQKLSHYMLVWDWKGVPEVNLWDMHNTRRHKTKSLMTDKRETDSIDSVPPNPQISSQRAVLFRFEEYDVVIKMIIKGRSPPIRHISRTRRVNPDWLGDQQIADILTKGSFTWERWTQLTQLFFWMTPQMRSCRHSLVFPSVQEDAKMSTPYHRKRHRQTKAGAYFVRWQPSLIKFVIRLYQFDAEPSRERFRAR